MNTPTQNTPAPAVTTTVTTAKTVVETVKVKETVDWSKLSEDAVYDMRVPIKAIEHQLPEHLIVKLLDPNYHPRWVHQHPQRQGQMRAVGYTYVTKEDLAEPLKIDAEDENGRIKYIDAVLMKIPKEKYFGQLRRNHEKSLALTNQHKAHVRERERISNDLAEDPDFKHYNDNNKIGIF